MQKLARMDQLQVNPAQMRTRIKVDQLCQLAIQVQGGIDRSLPLLVRRYAGQPGEVLDGEHFVVISGHRRWLARMIALVTAGGGLEQMHESVKAYCKPEDGWIALTPELYRELAAMLESETAPVQVWEGTDAEECLTLIRANMGAEQPDLAGMAHAFQESLDRNISLESLAQAAGMPPAMAQAILAIDVLPAELRELVNDRRLALEVVPRLVELDRDQLHAIARAVKVHASDHDQQDYTNLVQHAIDQLNYVPIPVRRSHCAPAEHNTALMVREIWQKAKEQDPEAFYDEVARRSMEGYRTDSGQTMMAVLAQMPMLEQYFSGTYYGASLKHTALDLLPDDARCENCVFLCLPDKLLVREMDIPCRQGRRQRSFPEAGVCFHWTPESEKFSIRTPYYWHEGAKEVKSKIALSKAWMAQQAYEEKEMEVPASSTKGSGEIEAQRRAIAFYMEHHTKPPFIDHPWATPCARCRHRLDESPVKAAPDAPHCRWSKGRHSLHFEAYVPSEGEISPGTGKILPADRGLINIDEWEDFDPSQVEWIIPSCRQFEPVGDWAAIIPESPTPAPFPRSLLISMLMEMVKDINNYVYSADARAALQWLTGRPDRASQNHKATFRAAFKKAKESLSDGQIWTLVQWASLEWLRRQSHTTMQHVAIKGQVISCSLMQFMTALNLMVEDGGAAIIDGDELFPALGLDSAEDEE